ncbi:MAG TPA: hypothetical protein VGI54_10840, partial [Solirubrobacteraceae bacterium]
MFRTARRLAPAIAALSLAAVPAGAAAHTSSFGSSLNHSPANAGSTCEEDGLTGFTSCTHVGSYYPGFSGHAKSPNTGTITKIKLRAQGPTTMTFKVVNVRHVAANHRSGQAQATAKTRTVQVNGPTQDQADDGIYPTETFNVHMKVRKGQELAVDTPSNTAEYCSDGTPGQLLFAPTLKLGKPFASSQGVDD